MSEVSSSIRIIHQDLDTYAVVKHRDTVLKVGPFSKTAEEILDHLGPYISAPFLLNFYRDTCTRSSYLFFPEWVMGAYALFLYGAKEIYDRLPTDVQEQLKAPGEALNAVDIYKLQEQLKATKL